MIQTDYVNQEGLVTDQPVETYYCPPVGLADNPNGRYLRVFADCDTYNVEARIGYDELENLGWRKVG